MVLITAAVYLYKKHHDEAKKNSSIAELAHDGNFTLPDPNSVPLIPENAEAGTHWRMGVDPAAKGAVHHDSDLGFMRETRSDGARETERRDRNRCATLGSVRSVDSRASVSSVSSVSSGSSGNSNSSISTTANMEGAWDEVADMVECPTPRQSDFDAGWGRQDSLKRAADMRAPAQRPELHRSTTNMSVMSSASTDSWTSRYSCMTDGRPYSEYDDDDDDVRSVKFFSLD